MSSPDGNKMSLNQRLIAGLLLLVALVITVALLAVSTLRGAGAHDGLAQTATLISWIAIPLAILIAAGIAMRCLPAAPRGGADASYWAGQSGAAAGVELR